MKPIIESRNFSAHIPYTNTFLQVCRPPPSVSTTRCRCDDDTRAFARSACALQYVPCIQFSLSTGRAAWLSSQSRRRRIGHIYLLEPVASSCKHSALYVLHAHKCSTRAHARYQCASHVRGTLNRRPTNLSNACDMYYVLCCAHVYFFRRQRVACGKASGGDLRTSAWKRAFAATQTTNAPEKRRSAHTTHTNSDENSAHTCEVIACVCVLVWVLYCVHNIAHAQSDRSDSYPKPTRPAHS